MLVTVVAVAGVATAALAGASAAFGSLVDRRWPADEPMSPAELLWGEVGGHVQKTFPGLDPAVAVDLTPYLRKVSVPAGEAIVRAGDTATDFFVITKGQAAVGDGPPSGPGDGLGGEAILGGGVHHHTIVATQDCTLLALPAEDYVAAVTLSFQEGDEADPDEFVANRMSAGASPPSGTVASPESPPETSDARPDAPVETPPVEAFAAPAAPGPRRAVVTATELPGFVLPGGDTPTSTLDEGMVVTVIESLAGWVHVRTGAGWQGWVEEDGLETLEEGDR